MLRVGSIVIRVDDLQRQAAFWEAVLDYERRVGADDDFILLRPKDGVGPNVSLDAVPAKVQVPPRIHLDLYTEDQAGEVERLKGLGATEIHWDKRPPDADYVILADPKATGSASSISPARPRTGTPRSRAVDDPRASIDA